MKFNSIEKLTIIYAAITGLFAIFFGAKDNYLFAAIAYRVLFVAIIFGLIWLNAKKNTLFTWFIRTAFPLALIAFWYPETYYFNENIFANLDSHFAAADNVFFGCQPSIEFSKHFPQAWVSELMNFGYFSYYFFIAGAVFLALPKSRELTEKIVFLILCSFFIYYISFIILPVVGPQFYFVAPENSIPCQGIFRRTMLMLQDIGERPTGAFPSSHVGVCLICMWLILKQSKKIFFILIPFAVILICSTVYIKAHYLVDVIGGFISAPIYFWISTKIFSKLNTKKH